MRTLKIEEIKVDPKINIRDVNMARVAEYLSDMTEYGDEWQKYWKEKPIITEDNWLWSGFHTIEAARMAFGADSTIEVNVEGSNWDDAYYHSVGTNADHGHRRTNAEKRNAVFRLLEHEDHRKWTDAHIARKCRVSVTVVRNVEKSMLLNNVDDYDRPTRRKYINKWGQEEWVETANKGKRTDLEEKPEPQKDLIDLTEEIQPEPEPISDSIPPYVDVYDDEAVYTEDDLISVNPGYEDDDTEDLDDYQEWPDSEEDEPKLVMDHQLWSGNSKDNLPHIESESVELICLDPPYNTGKSREKDGNTYDDSFSSGDDFIEFLRPIIEECYRILTPNGSLYLFCDQHAKWDIYRMLCEIFGKENMANEIIWSYDWGGRSKNKWAEKHDTIFYFRKNANDYIFDIERCDMLEKTAANLPGRFITKFPTDVWQETIVTSTFPESTGYPTQKPMKIIERIVNVCSERGNTVLDCFAGSGTVGDACEKNARNSILMEKNPEAIEIIRDRLPGIEEYS